MGRSRYTGPVAGHYVTRRLIQRVAVTNGNTTTVDRLKIPQGFVACQVMFYALGTTATVEAAVTNRLGTAGTGFVTLVADTPNVVKGATISGGLRANTPQGDELLLQVRCSGGAGAAPLGSVYALVTGYFTEHISRSRYAEHGQGVVGGPVVGHYDVWTMHNGIAVTPGGAFAIYGRAIAPFAARLMAVVWDMRGHTETTGAIIGRVADTTAGVFFDNGNLDLDVNEQFLVHTTSTPALANRNIAQGDSLALWLGAGAADAVPIGAVSAHLIVWCKGHYDNTNVLDGFDALESVPGIGGSTGSAAGDVGGPIAGSMVVFPLVGKLASGAGTVVQDNVILPFDARIVCVDFSKQAASTDTTQVRRNTTAITPAFSTQSYILHNEGTNIGTHVGNTVVAGVPKGEDSDLRYLTGDHPDADVAVTPDNLQFVNTGAGAASLSDTAHVYVAVRSHVYDHDTND